jgi:hypothetical protein
MKFQNHGLLHNTIYTGCIRLSTMNWMIPRIQNGAAALDLLPADMRTQTGGLMAADRRIAQEATGWEQ